MPKNIVICCDGTGNEIEEHQSNVLKFYRTLVRDETQVAYYDPGVGTISDSTPWARLQNRFKGIVGLAFGVGLDANVLEAYRFLITNYESGDRIWLFGYSRGAYTVRVLGGLLHAIGLLKPHQDNLCGYALTTYKQSDEETAYAPTRRFRRVLGLERPQIHFMGCWDTVGSVIVPRLDELKPPTTQTLPYTKRNPSVARFRHALAIDERRRMFRPYAWDEDQLYVPDPPDHLEDFAAFIVAMNDSANQKPQDCLQMWFAGVHGDIGGGYPEPESAAAKAPLAWMIDEAQRAGLAFDEREVAKLAYGRKPPGDVDEGMHDSFYVGPNATDPLHDSMKPLWRLLEWLPKSVRNREWPKRAGFLGLYFPRSEPRRIPDGAAVHASVRARERYGRWRPRVNGPAAAEPGAPYKPVNLPADADWRD